MSYYVLQVLTGEEEKFIELARLKFRADLPWIDAEKCIMWPRRRLTIKKQGVEKESLAPIFPGYLFFETDEGMAHLS